MPGTKAGGLKARDTNKARHGDDFFNRIGKQGGENGNTGGFASPHVGSDGLTGRQRARVVGSIGGIKSRRKSSKMERQWQNQNSTVSSSTLRATKPSEKSDANSSSPSKPTLRNRLRRLGR